MGCGKSQPIFHSAGHSDDIGKPTRFLVEEAH
jgi:hypothetical protein